MITSTHNKMEKEAFYKIHYLFMEARDWRAGSEFKSMAALAGDSCSGSCQKLQCQGKGHPLLASSNTVCMSALIYM